MCYIYICIVFLLLFNYFIYLLFFFFNCFCFVCCYWLILILVLIYCYYHQCLALSFPFDFGGWGYLHNWPQRILEERIVQPHKWNQKVPPCASSKWHLQTHQFSGSMFSIKGYYSREQILTGRDDHGREKNWKKHKLTEVPVIIHDYP